MEKDDVFTIIVKKFSLGKDCFGSDIYIYRPLELQNGFISEDIFYNDNAREYRSIDDISFISKEYDEGYFLPLTRDELKEQFDIESDEDIYHFFQNIIENQIIVSNTEEEGMYSIITFDKSKLVDDSHFSCEYTDGKVVVPIDDVR